MPFKCCVPKCNGNYKNGPKVSTFSFPQNNEQKKKWLRAICRQDFCPTNNSKVCELHFQQDEIERTTHFYSESSGERLSAPLLHPRLIEGAVPSQLPGCPRYLSKPNLNHREAPEEKRQRLEASMMKEGTLRSLESENRNRQRKTFNSIEELYTKLNNLAVGDWITRKKENEIRFYYIDETTHPYIKCCVNIKENLKLCVFRGDVEITSFCGNTSKFPMSVHNLNQIEDVLNLASREVAGKSKDRSLKENVNLLDEILEALTVQFPIHRSILEFIKEQINLLFTSNKNRLRYAWETILFCALLHSISPHSYKFLRSSGKLVLPSSSTLKRVCSNFSTNPCLEQDETTFLRYAASKYKLLNAEDRMVVLALDEIHLKPYMDYKGGNIVGSAYNSVQCATSAHTFMINSILSSYKDVVHILPVKTLQAPELHQFIKKIILGLEEIGFNVLAVASDNNAINKKAMSFFSNPPQILNEYQHPQEPTRPLFYSIDTVHIFKCLLSNWLNQKPDPYMKFPDFQTGTMRLASFNALREMHKAEKQNLLKYGYTLTLKALYPTSIERQNVKLATQIFNSNIVTALMQLGPKNYFESFEDTATYIGLISKWWDVVNVKTLWKGRRLNNIFQEPITKNSHHIINFLNDFLKWLDRWDQYTGDGKLTKETHFALKHTTNLLIKISEYCLEKKGLNFFLCGKIQTDKLEERFGKYRQQAGAQYHISIRQVFECESKLRIQSLLPLILESNTFGDIQITSESISNFMDISGNELNGENTVDIPITLRINCVVDEDIISSIKDDVWPILVYIAGYASYSAIKKFKCEYCKTFIIAGEDEGIAGSEVITGNNRGGLCYPNEDIITCAAYSYQVINKLLSSENEPKFLKVKNQRQVAATLIFESLCESDYQLLSGHNCMQHTCEALIKNIILPLSNILLNNYTKKQNDIKNQKTMPQCKRFKPCKQSYF